MKRKCLHTIQYLYCRNDASSVLRRHLGEVDRPLAFFYAEALNGIPCTSLSHR